MVEGALGDLQDKLQTLQNTLDDPDTSDDVKAKAQEVADKLTGDGSLQETLNAIQDLQTGGDTNIQTKLNDIDQIFTDLTEDTS